MFLMDGVNQSNFLVFRLFEWYNAEVAKVKRIIVANWKMNPSSVKEAGKLFSDVVKAIPSLKNTEVVICPPFLYLEQLRKISRKIILGAQDVSSEECGAFTGDVSAEMLFNMGAKYVITGHSERRARGEGNSDVNKKIKSALSVGLVPILCVGESARDESHGYFNLVKTQLEECLNGIQKASISNIIIAYEPVWAISSTVNRQDAIPADCREMVIFIRKIISDKIGVQTKMPKILYGGSVNDKDVEGFLKDGGVDGVLVGRASLDAEKFSNIIKVCEALNK